MECVNGTASVAGNGVDMNQGTQKAILPDGTVWFNGKGYLFPAFPFNSFHHFNFYIFETDAPFNATRLAEINSDFPAHNPLQGAWNLSQIMSWLGFSDPVARTWMDVTTSYWSMVRMAPLVKIDPPLGKNPFITLQCPCNLYTNAQGVNVTGDAAKAALV